MEKYKCKKCLIEKEGKEFFNCVLFKKSTMPFQCRKCISSGEKIDPKIWNKNLCLARYYKKKALR